jgi:hypothetical protein
MQAIFIRTSKLMFEQRAGTRGRSECLVTVQCFSLIASRANKEAQ